MSDIWQTLPVAQDEIEFRAIFGSCYVVCVVVDPSFLVLGESRITDPRWDTLDFKENKRIQQSFAPFLGHAFVVCNFVGMDMGLRIQHNSPLFS